MSLVPTFAKINGKWYQNPTITDETNEWFICFDDDDDPELVAHCPMQLSKKDRFTKLNKILLDSNIDAEITSHGVSGSRTFPPGQLKSFKPAIYAFLEINHLQNIQHLNLEFDGVYTNKPTNIQCHIIQFEGDKDVREIHVHNGKDN